MCGICGFQLKPGAEEKVDARQLMAELLKEIEWRGRDATGVAWWGPNEGRLCLDKQPVSASKYANRVPLSRRTRTAIGHTRLATQGAPEFGHNNHPVRVGNVGSRTVGVHNGVVYNDTQLWFEVGNELEQKGEVDTEALYAYLHYRYQGETPEDLTEVSGSFALAWLNEQDPGVLRVMRGVDSPLHLAFSDYGVVFASTKPDVKNMETMFGPYHNYMTDTKGNLVYSSDGVFAAKEGEWFVFEDGELTDSGMCEVEDPWVSRRAAYNRPLTPYGTPYGCDLESEDVYSEYFCQAGDDQPAMNTLVVQPKDQTGRPLAMVDRWAAAESRSDAMDRVADFGWDYRLKDGALWEESLPVEQEPGMFVHVYDTGEYLKDRCPAPPFWCNIDPAGPDGPGTYGFERQEEEVN